MADTLGLRERIENALKGALYPDRPQFTLDDAKRVNAILPVVEQAIQQEVYAAREETAAAALAKLGEKDAQIAALRERIRDLRDGLHAIDRHEKLSTQWWMDELDALLRETPAPPEPSK